MSVLVRLDKRDKISVYGAEALTKCPAEHMPRDPFQGRHIKFHLHSPYFFASLHNGFFLIQTGIYDMVVTRK